MLLGNGGLERCGTGIRTIDHDTGISCRADRELEVIDSILL